jgi:hypothetical protein
VIHNKTKQAAWLLPRPSVHYRFVTSLKVTSKCILELDLKPEYLCDILKDDHPRHSLCASKHSGSPRHGHYRCLPLRCGKHEVRQWQASLKLVYTMFSKSACAYDDWVSLFVICTGKHHIAYNSTYIDLKFIFRL